MKRNQVRGASGCTTDGEVCTVTHFYSPPQPSFLPFWWELYNASRARYRYTRHYLHLKRRTACVWLSESPKTHSFTFENLRLIYLDLWNHQRTRKYTSASSLFRKAYCKEFHRHDVTMRNFQNSEILLFLALPRMDEFHSSGLGRESSSGHIRRMYEGVFGG